MSSIVLPNRDRFAFLSGDATGKPIKGPIGRDPKEMPVFAMDEKTLLGHIKIYVLEDCWVKTGVGDEVERIQVFWKEGRCLGVCHFGQPKPAGVEAPDAITMHPHDRELLMKSFADQRQRYKHARPPLASEKYPGSRKKTLH